MGDLPGPSTFHAHNLHETIKCRTINVGATNNSPFGSQRSSIQFSRQATNTSLAALSPIPVNRNVQSNTSRSMHDFDAYVFSPDEKVKPTTTSTGAYNNNVPSSHGGGGVSRTISPGKPASKYHVAKPKLRADQWGVTTDNDNNSTFTDARRKCDAVDISNPHPFVPQSYYSSSYTGIKHREKLFLTSHMVAEELEEATNGSGNQHHSSSSYHLNQHEGSPIADRQARVMLRQRSEQERYTTAKDTPRKISTVYFDGQLQYLMEVDRQRRRQQRTERRQKRHAFKEARRRELTTAALGLYGDDDNSHVDVTLSPLSGNNDGDHDTTGSNSFDDSLSDSSSSDPTTNHHNNTTSSYHGNEEISRSRIDGRLKRRGSGGGGALGGGAGGDGGFYELLVPQDEADRHRAAQEAAVKEEKRRIFQQQVDGASREAAERDVRIRLLEAVERGEDVSKLLDEPTHRRTTSPPRPNTNNIKSYTDPNQVGGGSGSNPNSSNQELLSQKQRSAHVLNALDVAYERDASLLYGPAMVASTQLTGLGLQQTYSTAQQSGGLLTDAAHQESARTCGVMYPSLNMSCDQQWSSISTGVTMSLNDKYKRGELGGAAPVVPPPPTPQTKVVKVASTPSPSSSPVDRSPRTKSIDAGNEELMVKKEGKSVRMIVEPVEGTIPTGVVDVGGDDGHGLRRKQTQSDLKRKTSVGNMLSRTAQSKAKVDAANMANHSSALATTTNNNNSNPHEPSFITVSLPAEKVGEEDRQAPIEIPDSTYAAEAIADGFIREHNLNVDTVRKPLIEFLLHASTNDIISRAEAKGKGNKKVGTGAAGAAAAGVKPKRTASLVPRCARLPNPKVQHLEAQREKAIEEAKQVVKKPSIVSAGSKKIIEQMLAREEQEKAFYTEEGSSKQQPHSLHRRASLALPAHLRLHPQGQEDALQEYYDKHGRLPSSSTKRGSSSGAGSSRRPSSAVTTPRIAAQSPGSRLHAHAKDRQERLAIKSREASAQRSKAEMKGVTLKPKITPAGRSAVPKYSQPRGSQEPTDVVSEERELEESELSATQRRQVVIADVTFGEIQMDVESGDDSASDRGTNDSAAKIVESPPRSEVSPVARRPRSNAVSRAAPHSLQHPQNQTVTDAINIRVSDSEEQPAPRSPIVTRSRGNAVKGPPRPRSSTATFSDANRPITTTAPTSTEHHQDVGSRLYNQRDSAKERRDSLRAYHENIDPATGQKLFKPNLAPR